MLKGLSLIITLFLKHGSVSTAGGNAQSLCIINGGH